MYGNDSNAPWNQVDPADVFGDAAHDHIKEEINSHDDNFIDWACERGYLSEDFDDEELERIADDDEIRDEYDDYRFDDVVMQLAADAADARDYERERYRE